MSNAISGQYNLIYLIVEAIGSFIGDSIEELQTKAEQIKNNESSLNSNNANNNTNNNVQSSANSGNTTP